MCGQLDSLLLDAQLFPLHFPSAGPHPIPLLGAREFSPSTPSNPTPYSHSSPPPTPISSSLSWSAILFLALFESGGGEGGHSPPPEGRHPSDSVLFSEKAAVGVCSLSFLLPPERDDALTL